MLNGLLEHKGSLNTQKVQTRPFKKEKETLRRTQVYSHERTQSTHRIGMEVEIEERERKLQSLLK